jgi:phosphoenolpyruvate carboxylase
MSYVAAGVAIVGVGTSVYKGIHAHNLEKKAQRERDAMKEPFFKVQDEYYQNRNIAESNAQQGISQASKDYQTVENERALSSSIKGLKDGGGSPNAISGLFDTFNRSVDRTAAEDSMAHLQNIQYYMDQNANIGNEKQKQWSLNEDQPYQRKLKEITERIGASKQNENNAANEAIGAASAYATSRQNKSLIDALNKRTTDTKSPDTFTPINASNQPKSGLDYIPLDEQLPQ